MSKTLENITELLRQNKIMRDYIVRHCHCEVAKDVVPKCHACMTLEKCKQSTDGDV